jgi:hypothetical protein
MIADAQCSFCNMTTGREHEVHCPMYSSARVFPVGVGQTWIYGPDNPPPVMISQSGWVCPRCGVVHAPWVS